MELPMKNVLAAVKRFVKNEDGPTAVEYAVMLALIIVLCIVVIRQVGTSASKTFSVADSALR
jgi:pilus assembly protein Flp/PilA